MVSHASPDGQFDANEACQKLQPGAGQGVASACRKLVCTSNLLEEALKHTLKSGSKKLLAEVLSQKFIKAINIEDFLHIDYLMQNASSELDPNNLQFLLFKAWQKLYQRDNKGIFKISRQAEKIMKSKKQDPVEQDSLRGQLSFFKGYLAFTHRRG